MLSCLLLLLTGLVTSAAAAREDQRASPVELLAGVAEIDITPPPGLPLFGYSRAGQPLARGYWTRLAARVIYLVEQNGERVVLVQADLGAPSDLLRQRVIDRLGVSSDGERLTLENLVLMVTHTHAGPCCYFGARIYNHLGAKVKGFDPGLLDWLAARIAQAIGKAEADLEPVRLGFGRGDVGPIVRNRSLEAWQENWKAAGWQNHPPPYSAGKLPILDLLRIERRSDDVYEAKAALLFVPVHGTAVGKENDLYHGDLFTVAAKRLSERVAEREGGRIVVAVVSGASGDMSPDWTTQGRSEAVRLGTELAEIGFDLWSKVGLEIGSSSGSENSPSLRLRYGEFDTVGGEIDGVTLCDRPRAGVALLAGAEDGRSGWYGRFGIIEGRAGKDSDSCHGRKVKALGGLQRFILTPDSVPQRMPLHQIVFGDRFAIVTVPGEPTTEVGRQLRQAMHELLGVSQVAVVGYSDEYMSYVTTAAEYDAQHYEGAATLLGPRTAEYILAAHHRLSQLDPSGEGPRAEARYAPGPPVRRLSVAPCGAVTLSPLSEPRVETDDQGRLASADFEWRGLTRASSCTLPHVAVECRTGRLAWRRETEDSGVELVVRQTSARKGNWRVVWTPDRRMGSTESCRFALLESLDDEKPPLLVSGAFGL